MGLDLLICSARYGNLMAIRNEYGNSVLLIARVAPNSSPKPT